jgi:hypothetical protein
MTQTEQLSGAALNLALAFAQGWRLEKVGARYIITAPDGKQEMYQKKAWAEARILKQCPDWSSDVGAALALCLDIGAHMQPRHAAGAADLGGRAIAYFLQPHTVYTGGAFNGFTSTLAAEGDTPALALARLALAALTQEAG